MMEVVSLDGSKAVFAHERGSSRNGILLDAGTLCRVKGQGHDRAGSFYIIEPDGKPKEYIIPADNLKGAAHLGKKSSPTA